MSVINTNITSMIGQQNLNKSQNALTTSMERLSSGLRINSAKDDAAGQAIANRMSSQITGLSTAQRNANDGISVAQTAEGGLNQINDNLQRVRELTVQAQNDTNSQDDLDSIQAEIEQRMEEINRISKETDFNGTKVLGENEGATDPTARTLNIQVGANDGETIEIKLEQINRETLKLGGFNINDKGETQNTAADQAALDKIVADPAGNVELNGSTYSMVTANDPVGAQAVLEGIEEGVKVEVTAGAVVGDLDANLGNATTGGVALDGIVSDGEGGFTYDITGGATAAESATYIGTGAAQNAVYTTDSGSKSTEIIIQDDQTITDREGTELFITAAGELTYDNVGGSLDAATTTNLTTAIGASTTAGDQVLTLEDGSSIESVAAAGDVDIKNVKISAEDLATAIDTNSLTVTTTTTASRDGAAGQDPVVLTGTGGGTVTATSNGNAIYENAAGELTQADQESVDLIVNDNGKVTDAAANQYFVGSDGNLTAEAVTEGPRTTDPLEKLDAALAQVDALRSDLGAVQNRFESAITNLSTNETNLSAARSRIEDADYAVEVANMTRAQILQQAGTSVLAQANQIPQSVLSLLG